MRERSKKMKKKRNKLVQTDEMNGVDECKEKEGNVKPEKNNVVWKDEMRKRGEKSK